MATDSSRLRVREGRDGATIHEPANLPDHRSGAARAEAAKTPTVPKRAGRPAKARKESVK